MWQTTRIDLEDMILNEISQTKEAKYCMLSLNVEPKIYKKLVNRGGEKKQTHRYKKQTSGYQWGEGSGEGQDWGRGLGSKDHYVENK